MQLMVVQLICYAACQQSCGLHAAPHVSCGVPGCLCTAQIVQHDLTMEEKKMFLKFFTGSDR